jgi:hypothetical protein
MENVEENTDNLTAQQIFEKTLANESHKDTEWVNHEVLGPILHNNLNKFLKDTNINPETLAYNPIDELKKYEEHLAAE